MKQQEIGILIKLAKDGDRSAFGKLYEAYAQQLYRFALYTLKNTYDAEDAVQNAAIAAFRKIKSLKNNDSFKSWFFKILYNECMKIAGEKSRRYEILTEDISIYEAFAPHKDTDDDAMSLLSSLSEKEKAVVILTVLEEYSSKEAARILGMTPGSVRSMLSRSLAKLRKNTEGDKNE